MEVVLPFSQRKFSTEYNSAELRYTAILSRDSLFYSLQKVEKDLLFSDTLNVKDVAVSSSKTKRNLKFSKVSLAFNNPLYTFVPSSDFIEEHTASYLTFSNQITDLHKYKFCASYLAKFDIYLVYAIPKRILKSLGRYLGPYDYTHYQDCFLSYVNFDPNRTTICASLIDNNLNIALIKHGQLTMSNTYSTYNDSELYYFISLIFDQYNIRVGEASILLQGDFAEVQLDRNRIKQLFGTYAEYDSIFGAKDRIETSTSYMPLIHVNKCVLSQAH